MKALPLLLLVLTLLVAGCGSSSDEASLVGKITVDNFEFSQIPGGARIVTGELHNGSQRHLDNLQVKITLYDADNRRVTDMNVTVRDVAPGGHKGFRQPLDTDADVQGARVKSVLVL